MDSNTKGGVVLKRISSAREIMSHRSDDSAGSRSSMNRSANNLRHSRGRYKLALAAGPDASSTLVSNAPSLDVAPKKGRSGNIEEVILEHDNNAADSKSTKKKKQNNNKQPRKSVVHNSGSSSSSSSSTDTDEPKTPRRQPMATSYPLRLRALNQQLNETTLFIIRDSTNMDDLRNTTAGQLGLFARRFFRANGQEILDISDVYDDAAAGQVANKPLMLYVSNGKDFKEASQLSTGQHQQPTLAVTVAAAAGSTHQASASVSSVASAATASTKGRKASASPHIALDATRADNFTVAVLGGERVGKTSLVVQYLQHVFLDNPVPTIEDVYTSTVDVEGSLAKLEIVDTAGQHEFEEMRDEWMTKADGYLFVYSMTNSDSMDALFNFYDIHRKLVKSRSENMLDKVPFILVANNKDLADRDPSEIQVSRKRAQEIAKDMGVPHFEVSALTGENVDKVFMELVKRIRKAKGKKVARNSVGGALSRNVRRASLATGRTLKAVKVKRNAGRSSVVGNSTTNPIADRSMAEQSLDVDETRSEDGAVSGVGGGTTRKKGLKPNKSKRRFKTKKK